MVLTDVDYWTVRQYRQLPPDTWAEILKGELCMNPAPSSEHQEYAHNLTLLISLHVKQNRLGKVFPPPFDVILADDIILQPDLTLILKAHLDRVQPEGLVGSPDLVVEVVSPSSLRRDLEVKRQLYAQAGISEYWIVFPEQKAIEVLVLTQSHYEVHAFASLRDPESALEITSPLLPGLVIPLREVFESEI